MKVAYIHDALYDISKTINDILLRVNFINLKLTERLKIKIISSLISVLSENLSDIIESILIKKNRNGNVKVAYIHLALTNNNLSNIKEIFDFTNEQIIKLLTHIKYFVNYHVISIIEGNTEWHKLRREIGKYILKTFIIENRMLIQNRDSKFWVFVIFILHFYKIFD